MYSLKYLNKGEEGQKNKKKNKKLRIQPKRLNKNMDNVSKKKILKLNRKQVFNLKNQESQEFPLWLSRNEPD